MKFLFLPPAAMRRFAEALRSHCVALNMQGVTSTRRWKTALLLQPAAHS